jgi:hypothetical protein
MSDMNEVKITDDMKKSIARPRTCKSVQEERRDTRGVLSLLSNCTPEIAEKDGSSVRNKSS